MKTVGLIALWLVSLASLPAKAGQSKSARPPARPPAKSAPAADSGEAAARAERVMQHLRDVELLSKLNQLSMSREQAASLLTALEQVWERKRARRAVEDGELARAEEVLAEARAAMIFGQVLPKAYVEQLSAQVDAVMFITYQNDNDIHRTLADRVNRLFSSAQLARALPPVSSAVAANDGRERRGGGSGGFGGSPFGGAFGGANPASPVAAGQLRSMPPQQYAMTRMMLSGSFRMTPLTAEERAQRQALLEKLDRTRALTEAEFEREKDTLGPSLREEMTGTMMTDMLRDLRSIPKPLLDSFRPMALNMATQGLDPDSAAQLREELMQFSDAVRQMSPQEFEAQRVRVTQQLSGSLRRVEELQRTVREQRQLKQADDRAAEHYRKAMEEFVARTLMHPRTVGLLKERLK